jgi:hypothetical protein
LFLLSAPCDDLRWLHGQGFPDVEPVFHGRRDYGPEVRELLRSLERSEGSRDFHEQLHHVQVLFGLVVGEWDCKVVDEAQDVITVVNQAEEQIVTWPPGLWAAGAGVFSQLGLA